MSRRFWTIFAIAHAVLAYPIAATAADRAAGAVGPTRALPPGSEKPLSAEEMSSISGGTALTTINTLTQQQLTATSTGNTVTAGVMTSGAVSFSPQALTGFNGIGNFVINTGANNSLQGAINLSIVTAPAG